MSSLGASFLVTRRTLAGLGFFLLAFGAPATGASFQEGAGGGMDGQVKEIVRKIQSEMEEIDKLLDQASRKSVGPRSNRTADRGASGGDSGQGGGAKNTGSDAVDKLLRGSLESNQKVLDNIQRLLDLAQQIEELRSGQRA